MGGIKIEDIYTWLASYKGLPFPVNLNGYLDYKKTQWGKRLSGDVFSIHGKTIIMPISIDGIVFGSGADGHINIQPMVAIECAKRIVKTNIAGSSYSGSVKEFITVDDYRINITGWVVNVNQKVYPYYQVELLQNLWLKNEALKFDSEITSDLFQYVVIENLKFDELKMAPGMQLYTMRCVSDGVQEVELLRQE